MYMSNSLIYCKNPEIFDENNANKETNNKLCKVNASLKIIYKIPLHHIVHKEQLINGNLTADGSLICIFVILLNKSITVYLKPERSIMKHIIIESINKSNIIYIF